MKELIIFGNGKIAEVICHFFQYESDYEVVAFTADKQYITELEFCGLPVVSFEELTENYAPDDHHMFVAVGYQDMNGLRQSKLDEVINKGFSIVSYIHPQAGVPKDLKIGVNCFIMNNVNIHPCVTLGDNVFVWSGAMIGHHSHIGNHTWITSAANVSGNVSVGESCFFAVNATVGHGVSIGKASFLGANSLITKSIPDETVIVAESDKPFRLNSRQFIRFSKFETL